MKNLKWTALLAITAFAAGCNDDDTSYKSIGLNGKWNVVERMTPFTGGSEVIAIDSLTWNFNESQHRISVEDSRTYGPATNYTSETGTHDYTIHNWANICDEALAFNNTEYGCISFANDTLYLSTAALDGPVYKLVR